MLKTISLLCGMFLLLPLLFSQNPSQSPVSDQLSPSIRAESGGFIGDRLDASYKNRILAQDVDRLINPFRNRTETSCWQSEFWGKWFTSAVLAYRYRPEPELKEILDKAVNGLISTQTPDGYIGNYAENSHLMSWDIWGRKYCMLGLIAYYDLTKDKNALTAAKRIASHLIKELSDRNLLIVKLGNHRGMAASSVLEPICLLYSRTGEKKYLEFAEEIVNEWETPDGPQLISKAGVDVARRFDPPEKNWYGWEQGQKAYEMMSCYEGLLELYRLKGNLSYKKAVEEVWENISGTEINIAGSGSAMECWFGGKELQNKPVMHYQETCVTATWIRFCQQLLRLTGDTKYADAIEVSYYNALLGAMRLDGSDWSKYTPLSGLKLEGSEQCGMGLNCCNASGPRALFTIPLTAVMADKEGIQVNFYVEGTYNLETPGKQSLTVIQQTDYPAAGDIHLKLHMKKPEMMSVKIRIPGWSEQSIIRVNGDLFEGITPGKCTEIPKEWRDGDFLDISFDMRGRVIPMGKLPETLAVMRGPIVLSRDSRLEGPGIEAIVKPVSDRNGFLNLELPDQKNPEIWMEFKAMFEVESYKESASAPESIVLCDYASAGNGSKSLSQFKVWLPQLLDPRKIKPVSRPAY